MQLALDIDTGRITQSGQALSILTINRFFRGPIEISLRRNGVAIELPLGSAPGELGVYDKLGGNLLASCTEWTQVGSGAATLYVFDLNLNTPAIEGDPDANPAVPSLFDGEPEKGAISTLLQMRVAPPEQNLPSATLKLTIANSPFRGPLAETVPVAPEYPPSIDVLRKSANLAGLGNPAAARVNIGLGDFSTVAAAKSASAANLVMTPYATMAAIHNGSGPLARWFAGVAARVEAGECVNIWGGIDSLTAGAGGFSWIQPFRNMVQDALGDGGIGFQMPTLSWEFGATGVNYTNSGAITLDLDAPGDSIYGAGIDTLLSSAAASIIFNAGSIPEIDRETDEVDIYWLRKPAGYSSSFRACGFLSGAVFNGLTATGALGIGKQTLTGFSLAAGHAATYIAVDNNNAALRLTGFNFRRNCPGGGARVHFWAKGGSRVQQWAALDATTQQFYFENVGGDLLILNGGMNDRNGRTKAQYKADMLTLITRFRNANENGGIILVMPTIPAVNAGNLAGYREALLELATDQDCAFVDMAWILGENADAVAAGLILEDQVHPSEAGYRRIASYLYNFIGGDALRQLRPSKYGQCAPRRDVDATSVQGWQPGDPLALASEDPVRAPKFEPYYAPGAAHWRGQLSDKVVPNTAAGVPVKLYDLGITNGYPAVTLHLQIYMNRTGSGGHVSKDVYLSLSNATIPDQAGGYGITEVQKQKVLAGDFSDQDFAISVTNNGVTNRCEIYLTPSGHSLAGFCIGSYFFQQLGVGGQSVFEH